MQVVGPDSRLDSLVLDLVEWIALSPRPYADVMEAWRTSCPRLTVWEDAVDRGFVERRHSGIRHSGQGVEVVVTAAGRQFLRSHRRQTERQLPVAPVPA